jgi:hypothetical protein
MAMEAVCTCDISVHFNENTRRYFPEGSLRLKTAVIFEVKDG